MVLSEGAEWAGYTVKEYGDPDAFGALFDGVNLLFGRAGISVTDSDGTTFHNIETQYEQLSIVVNGGNDVHNGRDIRIRFIWSRTRAASSNSRFCAAASISACNSSRYSSVT